MKKILTIVERGKGKRNFSCFAVETIMGCGIGGYGATAREAMEDARRCVEEYKAMKAEEGVEFPDVELDFRFDVGSFFDYYPIDVTAFAKYIGMNASVVRQYVTSLRLPREEQMKKIRDGVDMLSRDLGLNMMLEHPVVSYVKISNH